MMMPVLNPHPVSIPALRTTSLDHAVWFHRDLRMDDWVLFELDSPICRGGRGLLSTRGARWWRRASRRVCCGRASLPGPNF